MLKLRNLHVKIDGKAILNGIDLTVRPGETHVIMGPNGSGKSTLASVLAGKPGYEITQGSITYNNKNLLELDPHERALAGIFLAFQYPVEIPGVSGIEFLRAAVNEQRKHLKLETLDPMEFQTFMKEKAELVRMDSTLLSRSMNDGFSGGEKKRNEILQMALLNPKLKILDETDSGLDIDSLKTIAQAINGLQTTDTATIVITHYQRILAYLNVDFVHILIDGKIVKSGSTELVKELELSGYENYRG